jgi:aminoglycoside 3-N-acetyltransferase
MMSALKNFIRSIVPSKLLNTYRERKKNQQRKLIHEQAAKGEGLTLGKLIQELQYCGIKEGDSVLVHSSFSKIGFVEGGPKTFVEGLLTVIGATGNLLMPSSPNGGYQLDYIRQLSCFDVQNDPSKMGQSRNIFGCFQM